MAARSAPGPTCSRRRTPPPACPAQVRSSAQEPASQPCPVLLPALQAQNPRKCQALTSSSSTHILAGAAPDSSSKRPRVAGGAPSLQTFRGMAATEEQALLALAADSQPASQSVLGGAATTTVGGVCRTFDAPTVGHLAASEEQALLAVAAGSQPSQSVLPGRTSVVVGGSRLGGGRPSSFMPAGGDDMDEDLDAILDELLDEEAGEQQQQQQEQGNQRTPAAAARPAAGAVPAAVPAAAPPAATAQQAQQGAEWLLPPRQYVPPAKEVYRIRGASLTVTSQSGERVYCSLEAPPVGGNRCEGWLAWLVWLAMLAGCGSWERCEPCLMVCCTGCQAAANLTPLAPCCPAPCCPAESTGGWMWRGRCVASAAACSLTPLKRCWRQSKRISTNERWLRPRPLRQRPHVAPALHPQEGGAARARRRGRRRGGRGVRPCGWNSMLLGATLTCSPTNRSTGRPRCPMLWLCGL